MTRRPALTTYAPLAIAILALAVAAGSVASSAPNKSAKPRPTQAVVLDRKGKIPLKVLPFTVSTKPVAGGLVRLDKTKKLPVSVIPAAADAGDADTLDGKSVVDLTDACPDQTSDLGSMCVDSAVYAPTAAEAGTTDFAFASQRCASRGGFLPSAAMLIGAARTVSLGSTIDDARDTASVDSDPADGLKDRREMSSTLTTTAAGSSAAGSEGVTPGSTGDPRVGEPDPFPAPADPAPDTLQYVTVFDNHNAGGFAGSKAVNQPEAFRCAYSKRQIGGR